MEICSRYHGSMEEWKFALGVISGPGKEVGTELGLEREAGCCLAHGSGDGGYEWCLAKKST